MEECTKALLKKDSVFVGIIICTIKKEERRLFASHMKDLKSLGLVAKRTQQKRKPCHQPQRLEIMYATLSSKASGLHLCV
jgi:hypothetical protein